MATIRPPRPASEPVHDGPDAHDELAHAIDVAPVGALLTLSPLGPRAASRRPCCTGSVDASAFGERLLKSRRFARLPIWLFRNGFGGVAGGRLLLLEVVGRRSGLPREVCLEVVERPSRDRIVIASGFGETAQWYRNLRAHPYCFVTLGRRRRIPATARSLSTEEADARLARYRQAHPRLWKRLQRIIEHAHGGPVGPLPMMELTLRAE